MRSLLWIVIIIIVYGSLFPFTFVWQDPSQIAWLDWGIELRQRTTNGDVLSNFLTFVPLGYFAYSCESSSSRNLYWKIAKVLMWTGLFAYVLQITQFFIPSRVPTVGDAFINLWGVMFGIFIAVSVQFWLKRNPQVAIDWQSELSVPLILCGCWILYQLFPFMPRFEIANFLASIAPIWQGDFFIWHEWIFLSVMWLSFFKLLEKLQWFSSSPLSQALTLSGLFLIKILVNYNEITLTSLLSAVSGLVAFQLLSAKITARTWSILICAAIFFREIFPFDTISGSTETKFNWVPFSYYLSGSMWVNTHSFLEKIFSYGSLIFVMTSWLHERVKTLAYCVGFILIIELLQLGVSYRAADVTDLLMVLIIGYTFRQFSQTKIV